LVQAILDSAASFGICTRPDTEDLRSKLLVFSAHRADSLQKSIDNYQVYVKKHPRTLRDLAYTLGARRDHLSYRAFCIAKGDGPLEVSSIKKVGAAPRINFVFTGQGAQWPKMAKELMDEFPAFLQDIAKLDNILNNLPYPPTWRIQGQFRWSVYSIFNFC
jgi:acyl transferase domain-containing protein